MRFGRSVIAMCMMFSVVFSSCGKDGDSSNINTDKNNNGGDIPQMSADIDENAQPAYCSIVAVGDNILHNTVMTAAKTDNGYDFTPFYSRVKPYIEDADIAIVNQESPLGGPDYSPSGYPNFNSPQQIGHDLVSVGFDVISHANNHAMDRGAGAVYDTIDFWKEYEKEGILFTGIYRDGQDREELRIMEKNGIKVGFLSYTYGTNGIPLPKDNQNLVSLIDKDRIKSDMDKLVPECDATIVIMHWGNEYTHTPTDEQRSLAEYITSLGADIIIGHHPHVIQPAEWIELEDGSRAFCIYSLGNFISSQNKKETMLEGMLNITIKKDTDGTVTVENPSLTPLVNYYNKGWDEFCIYPLSEYTDELAKTHSVGSELTPSYFRALAQEIFREFYSE